MPFHCVDIHMPNHSPPIATKPTSQMRRQVVRPITATFFDLTNAAGAWNVLNIWIAPAQQRMAASVSAPMIRM